MTTSVKKILLFSIASVSLSGCFAPIIPERDMALDEAALYIGKQRSESGVLYYVKGVDRGDYYTNSVHMNGSNIAYIKIKKDRYGNSLRQKVSMIYFGKKRTTYVDSYFKPFANFCYMPKIDRESSSGHLYESGHNIFDVRHGGVSFKIEHVDCDDMRAIAIKDEI